MGIQVFRHASWALEHVRNELDKRHDRRFTDEPAPQPTHNLVGALETITGAERDVISSLLDDVPEPSLRRESVLYGNPNGSQMPRDLIYVCSRLMQPNVVIETGVANGSSTGVNLSALDQNKNGRLISIDLPHLHPRALTSVGAAVDPAHQNRWRLRFAPAVQLLGRELGNEVAIDIFVQDASHHVRGPLAEYRTVWPRLRIGGLLITDDASHAFDTFASEVDCRPMYVVQSPKPNPIGIIQQCN